MRGIVPASATDVFKNERRELSGGIMVKQPVWLRVLLEQVVSMVAKYQFPELKVAGGGCLGYDRCSGKCSIARTMDHRQPDLERAIMPPTRANGKICYLEIPALDVARSSAFYKAVFSWQIRRRGDGSTAFDDGVGEVSGTWVTGRPPSVEPGLLIYIMVDSVAAISELVLAHGGEIVQPVGADAPEITARFRDPAGNILGLYQEPG